jgi:hypothetical protein
VHRIAPALRLFVVLATATALVLTSVPLPARGIGEDVINNPPAGWDTDERSCTQGCWMPANAFDNSDATFSEHGWGGGLGCPQDGIDRICTWSVRFDHNSGSTNSITISDFRVYGDVIDPVGGDGGLKRFMVYVSNNGTESVCYDSGSIFIAPGQQLNYDQSCTTEVTMQTAQMYVGLKTWGESNLGGWLDLRSFEVEASLGPSEVDITEYIYNLRIDHPAFERVITWDWADDECVGSWAITNVANEELDGEPGPAGNCAGEFIGERARIVISCPIVCGPDTYTIFIDDLGRNQTATYAIDGEASGQLIANSRAPVIEVYNACYNATTNQCSTLRPDLYTAQVAGKLEHNYRWRGDDSTVIVARRDETRDPPNYVVSSASVNTGEVEGQHARVQTITVTNQSSSYVLYIENGVGEYDYAIVTVNYGTGGHVQVDPEDEPDEGDVRDCNGPFDLALVACRLGQLLDIAGATFDASWTTTTTAIHDAAAAKLPFAYVVLAVDGMSEHLAAAAAEVENTDECAGVTLQVPLYYGSSPSDPTPSNLPVTVLTCEQLEPFMGTSWYQAIRIAMDPALWILFGWAQVKSLQPKPSLNG